MSNSPLSFVQTNLLRNELIVRNLPPYTVPGYYVPNVGNRTSQYIPRDLSVIDSTNEFVNPRTNTSYSNEFYRLNSFGPEGGYFDVRIGNQITNKPNQGEYNPNDTQMDLVNEFYIDAAFIENIYGPEGGFNQMVIIDDIQNNNKIYLPYWDFSPINFVPSSYSAYNVFSSNDPTGSDGSLSQDSALAKISALELKKQFGFRINRETTIKNAGVVSLDTLKDPNQASLLVTGKEKIYYQNWRITVSDQPNSSTDFASRLQGTYYPASPIPGDYFDDVEINGGQNRQTLSALNTVNRLFGNALGPIITVTNNPSVTFIQNTGNAQRSTLFQNLELNRYQPSYQKDNTNQNTGQSSATINLTPNSTQEQSLVGGYYVGSRDAEPSLITSPPNQVPVDPFGRQVQAPVFGNSELSILYEGNQNQIRFGLGGRSFSDDGGIDGDFVWISPKYRAIPGGGSGSLDEQFNQISSRYQSSQSTNIEFKPSSILDQTQRLINAADSLQGEARLKHVGNAINQVSKVFNDGYKELTKGSKVLSYTDNTNGNERGREYCRIFAKDTPYYTYADLQKTDGITTSGRRFSNSVLDNTYNLNIAPTKNPGSTNIQPNARGQLVAKKYMFSIENLAWRTSSRPGFTYDDLPTCERGPNGGRVMWFPPYDLTFSDSSSASFGSTSFLGRPEPIYTYKETSRSGTLSWKIIVDNPSVLNLIVDKQLKGVNRQRIDSIIDSFFAGCVKYDIYELAKKFNTIPISDLFTYQEILNQPRLTPEEYIGVGKEIGKENLPVKPQEEQSDLASVKDFGAEELFKTKYSDLGYYFDDDEPDKYSEATTSTKPYQETYSAYISQKSSYQNSSNIAFNLTSINYCKTNKQYCEKQNRVTEFFDSVIQPNYEKLSDEFIDELVGIFKQYPETKISITLEGTASAIGKETYNVNLSKRRIDSVKKFLETYTTKSQNSLKDFYSKIQITETPKGEVANVIPKSPGGQSFEGVNCNEPIQPENGQNQQFKYATNAMACRRVKLTINSIDIPSQATPPTNADKKSDIEQTKEFEVQRLKTLRETNSVDYVQRLKDGIGKRILRNLLTECDYFEVIKQDAPMIYDNIREKIKYFNPAFHSMTPEGLNARLTFLNQCVRPGETIPVIGTDGKPKFNDALNTSFGTPPILVFRIGDFYHTKIVPDGGVSFSYENNLLDLNPEGIGVQPMIVKVTMNFKIIGGMGLAKPVEQLQNALSFNFYANTEIYDERATPTEDTTAIDKNIVDALIAQQAPANVANTTPQATNDGGDTIGEIVTNIPIEGGQSGETIYKKIMDNLLDETSNYFEAVVNKLESINEQYNYGVVQILNRNRNYNNGFIKQADKELPIQIYGKPDFSSIIEEEFRSCIDRINLDFNPIVSGLTQTFQNSNGQENPYITAIKKNMVSYIEKFKSTYNQGITIGIQELTQTQEKYTKIIRKLNVVVDKTDGKLLDTNEPRIYNLSGTLEITPTNNNDSPPSDTYKELEVDYGTCANAHKKYVDVMKLNKLAFYDVEPTPTNGVSTTYKFSKITDPSEANFYFIMSRILTKKNTKDDFFKNVIKGNLTSVTKPVSLSKKFNEILDKLDKQYTEQLKEDDKNFSKLKKSKEYKDLTKDLKDEMYKKGKERKLNYTTIPTSNDATQKVAVKELYQQKNTGDNKSFIGKYKFD